jgi:hypothetical protein
MFEKGRSQSNCDQHNESRHRPELLLDLVEVLVEREPLLLGERADGEEPGDDVLGGEGVERRAPEDDAVRREEERALRRQQRQRAAPVVLVVAPVRQEVDAKAAPVQQLLARQQRREVDLRLLDRREALRLFTKIEGRLTLGNALFA